MNTEKKELWESFLHEWPLDRLQSMSLAEYTNLNRDDSFCYWLESKTTGLGSIWGGTSYKFGIYHRSGDAKEDRRSNYKTEGNYSWAIKYGQSKEEAFSTIRQSIASIAHYATDYQLEKIDDIDLSHTLKWKVAALYNRQIPLIFSTEMIDFLCAWFDIDKQLPYSTKLLQLAEKNSSDDIIAFSEYLWSLWDKHKNPSTDPSPHDAEWKIIAKTISKINNEEAVRKFFNLVRIVLTSHNLQEADERYYSAALLSDNRIHLSLGRRYTLAVEKTKNKPLIGFYARLQDEEKLRGEFGQNIRIVYYSNNKVKIGIWAEVDFDSFNSDEWIPSIIEASTYEMSHTKSQFRNRGFHNPWIYRAAFNQSILDALIIGTDIELHENLISISSIPLNQILYGPPGTGKTYHSINEALKIVNPSFYQQHQNNREKLRKEFNRLLIKDIESDDRGQIAFITFHQSMSYEDFIEGIKPALTALDEETAEQGESITYKVQKGIFRQMCDMAAVPVSIDLAFDSLWEKFVNDLMKQNTEVIFKSTSSELKLEKESSTIDGLKLRFKKSWDAKQEQGQAIFHVGKITIKKIFNHKINLTDPELRQWVAIRDIVGGGRATTHLAVYKSFFEHANLSEIYDDKKENLPYILIIDEINRGNISQIFGELITLIEADKREGADEPLSTTLPYSKQKFSVPKNLFIIGTMNTADRSIEALDTALRRRFTFTEMPPKPEIIREHGKSKGEIDGIDLIKLLETINKRIEKLLDKDHQIGHSYFMEIKDFGGLKLAFKNKVIPLLEEYFYGDMGKIGLVLGDSFVKLKEEKEFGFAKFDAYDKEILIDLQERRVFEIIDPESLQIDDFKKIYQL